MKLELSILMLCACVSLGSACDKGSSAGEKPAQGPAEPDAKANPAPAVTGEPPVNPHVIPAHKNPPPGAELGPPRDVTPSGTTRPETVDGLVIGVPEEWVRTEVVSQMRKGAFNLPGPGGDAQLIVYRFEGGAGTPEQNIERWKGQIEGGEAAPTELEAKGLKISALDVTGRFAGSAMPGIPPTPAIEEARLFAAAISGSGDPWYLKVVGPAKTLDVWAGAWTTMLGGLEVAP